MLRVTLACAAALMLLVGSASAQTQSQKEAEIKRLVPYSDMLRIDPSMTLGDYNRAVRDLAREQTRTTRPRSYTLPPAYTPPAYTPPVYVPSAPVYRAPSFDSGSTYDWSSGNIYNWRSTPSGTHVDGMNMNTGSMWQTDIRKNGSMSGWDSNMNPWTYDAGTKTYMNLGTGKLCVGEGLARICS